MGLQGSWWPSFATNRAILGILCVIHSGMLMVVGLRLENVSVPPSGILRGSVTLGCDYFLESDSLYSLKWYKDSHEFFRFFPGAKDSPTTTFPVPGVHVDLGESLRVQMNGVKLRLKNLDFSSAGTYRCEISADSPTFRTLHEEGNLSIMALPDTPKPVLTGFPSSILEYGGKIDGNCTFVDSYPAAELSLYLNNVKINNSSEFELTRHQLQDRREKLLTSVLQLKFRIGVKHFQGGLLQIRCEARLFDQRWETLWNISHQNYQTPFRTAGQNRYSLSGVEGFPNPTCLLAWILIAISVSAVIFH